MKITVSSSDGIDAYFDPNQLDAFNNPLKVYNDPQTLPNTKLKTISRAIDYLKNVGPGPHEILVESGTYREKVIIPDDQNLIGLSIIGQTDAGKCVISGADILTTNSLELNNPNLQPNPDPNGTWVGPANHENIPTDPNIITEGWQDLGNGLYWIKGWNYTFDADSVESIKTSRHNYYKEATKIPGYLSNYPLKKQIKENYSEHQVWVFPNNINSSDNLRDNANASTVKPYEEMQEVFNLDALQPGSFCVISENDIDPQYEHNYTLPKFPAGLYIKLRNQLPGQLFEDYAVLVSRRHLCMSIWAEKVTINSIGFRLSASPVLQGAVEINNREITLENCISEWQRGFGISVINTNAGKTRDTKLINCWANYNSQEGIVISNAVDAATLCGCQTNNNSLNARYLNILPPTHANKVAWPSFGGGGLVLKGPSNCLVIDHVSMNNLGNGIWQDHGTGLRVVGGKVANNFGSGITLERVAEYCEVFGVEIKENYSGGIRIESENCYVHNNTIVRNKRAGIGVIATKDSSGQLISTDCWLFHNTIVGNLTGIDFHSNLLRLTVVGNIIACSSNYSLFPLFLAGVNDIGIYDNDIYNTASTFIFPDGMNPNVLAGFTADIMNTNLFVDPKFSNSCSGDYSLSKDSELLGNGNGESLLNLIPGSIQDELKYNATCCKGSRYLPPVFNDIGAVIEKKAC